MTMHLRRDVLTKENVADLNSSGVHTTIERKLNFKITEDEIKGIYKERDNFPWSKKWEYSKERDELDKLFRLKIRSATRKFMSKNQHKSIWEYYEIPPGLVKKSIVPRLVLGDFSFNHFQEIKYISVVFENY